MNFSGVLRIACTSASHHQVAARPAEPGPWLALRRLSVGGAGPGPRPSLSHCSSGAGPPPRKLGALLPVRGSAHLRLPAGAWRPCRALRGGQCPSLPVSPGRCFRSAEGSWCLLLLMYQSHPALFSLPCSAGSVERGCGSPGPGRWSVTGRSCCLLFSGLKTFFSLKHLKALPVTFVTWRSMHW